MGGVSNTMKRSTSITTAILVSAALGVCAAPQLYNLVDRAYQSVCALLPQTGLRLRNALLAALPDEDFSANQESKNSQPRSPLEELMIQDSGIAILASAVSDLDQRVTFLEDKEYHAVATSVVDHSEAAITDHLAKHCSGTVVYKNGGELRLVRAKDIVDDGIRRAVTAVKSIGTPNDDVIDQVAYEPSSTTIFFTRGITPIRATGKYAYQISSDKGQHVLIRQTITLTDEKQDSRFLNRISSIKYSGREGVMIITDEEFNTVAELEESKCRQQTSVRIYSSDDKYRKSFGSLPSNPSRCPDNDLFVRELDGKVCIEYARIPQGRLVLDVGSEPLWADSEYTSKED